MVPQARLERALLSEQDFELLLSQVNIYLNSCNIYVFTNANALVC